MHWGKPQVEKGQALLFSETDPNDIKYRYGADGYNKILCEKCIRISIYDVDGNLLREWTPENNNGRSPFNFIGKEWGLYWEREILVGETLNFDNRNQRVKVALVYPITEEDIRQPHWPGAKKREPQQLRLSYYLVPSDTRLITIGDRQQPGSYPPRFR